MLIKIDTHVRTVVVTLEDTDESGKVLTGKKYTWVLDPDEATKVANGLLKAAELLEGNSNGPA